MPKIFNCSNQSDDKQTTDDDLFEKYAQSKAKFTNYINFFSIHYVIFYTVYSFPLQK